jgi:endonuclease-8
VRQAAGDALDRSAASGRASGCEVLGSGKGEPMPEGDTVHLAAQRLHAALAGQVLTRAELRVPQLATADLTGREVLAVVPRGKHLLTRLAGDLTLHTHFRMEGSFRMFRPGSPWTGGPAHEVRVVLGNPEWVAVGYRLPVVELLPTAREEEVVGHLGPDVLGPDWDAAQAEANLRRGPQQEIGSALLDQRNLAGLGNLYRIEALFLRGVSPWTAVADVADLPALISLGRRLITANRDRWAQTTTGRTDRGGAHYVFERQGRPCRRCGTSIRSARQGAAGRDRVTYWCPSCQPGPAPAGSAARAVHASGPRYRN